MSDLMDADFITQLWMSPPKGKQQKKKKKNVKHKKSRPTKTHEKVQKENKKSKFKEAMMGKTEKKKEKRKEKDREKKGKKKKKDNLALNLDDSKFVEGSQKLAVGNLCLNEKQSSSTEKPVKEPKNKKSKKMVAFGSLPSYIPVKRPIFASPALKRTEAVREEDSGSLETGKSQIPPQENDSQYNSDDINSQDLFITQKRFRASPSGTSSSEASDRVISESPHVFSQRDKEQPPAAGEIKRRTETSDKGRDRGIKTEKMGEIGEFLKPSGEISFLTNQAETKVSQHERPQPGDPFLDDPLVINPTPGAVLFQDGSSYRPYAREPTMTPGFASTSTQTENFFTTEISSYLGFCRKNRAALQSPDWKPLDLSLPHRARNSLCLSGETLDPDIKLEEEKGHKQESSFQKGEISCNRTESTSASPKTRHAERKMESLCPGEETPSPQSEVESRSANTTSSEDDQHCRAGKRDANQVTPLQPILRH